MASIFNIAKASKKPADDSEQTLLAMWQGKDADSKTECICVRWSPDDSILAAGCGDGVVRLYGTDGRLRERLGSLGNTGAGASLAQLAKFEEKLPVMSMRWKPVKDKQLVRVASADGTIELLDVKTKSSRATTKEVDKENNNKPNQTLSMDYSADGSMWATGGADRVVRVYDESNPKEPKVEMRGTLAGARGHSNRICAVRFSPDKVSMLASAGLDGTVMLWDARARGGEPFMTIPDVAVAGESIDISGMHLLTGSWRPTNQLQVWDIRNGKKIKDIPWKKKKPPPTGGGKMGRWDMVREAVKGSCNVYAAAYAWGGPVAGCIVAGGTGNKEVKVFSPQDTRDPLGAFVVPSGVHGLHVNNSGTLIGVAACDGSVYGVKMPDYTPKPAGDDGKK
jgi:COMPASS component SWD3